ncbi:MAG: aldehyde dehydrogenase [Gaiellaceae bacterium]
MTDRDRLLFIDGRWHPAASGTTATVIDPATGAAAGTTALAGEEDLEQAVRAARTHGRAWEESTAQERARTLARAAELIEERVDEIAVRLTTEQGKPLPDAAKEIRFAAEVFRYYGEEGKRIWGSLRPSVSPEVKSIVSYAPVGIVGAIVPWNYPVDLYAWKVAPALAAGCTVIAKPPADAPIAIAAVVEALADAGLPPGALADLPGGADLGNALVAHPDLAAITATVSTQTGRLIMAVAARTLKRLTLELGGQTPFIVLDDADLEEAAAAAVRRSFSNMGQICIAVNRVLVAEARREEFVEAVAERTRALQVGNGLESGVEYGPVFNDAVLEKTRAHIDDAIRRGARLVTGGGRLKGDGHFVSPAVLDAVPTNALAMTEETFGPVMPVAGARTDAELIDLANALPYGLAAYIYSRDLERAWAFADQIEAGAVGINVNDVTELQAPFGGWKLSGSGRDLGPEGMQTFLNTRHIRARVRRLG